jgi:phytoene dehydrogenase-like protein
LGRKGHKVLVLERNDRIGGCIRTEEITEPGFIHDVRATTFVLFITSPAFAELGPELEKRGLAFAHSPTPTAVLMPDGRHAILSMDRKARCVAAFDRLRCGARCRRCGSHRRRRSVSVRAFGGSLWSSAMLRSSRAKAWRQGLRGLATYFGGHSAPRGRGWSDISPT